MFFWSKGNKNKNNKFFGKGAKNLETLRVHGLRKNCCLFYFVPSLMQTFKVNTILTLTVDMTLHLDGIFQLEKRNRYT